MNKCKQKDSIRYKRDNTFGPLSQTSETNGVRMDPRLCYRKDLNMVLVM